MSLDLLKAENEGFPMRYMTSLYLKYFLRKLPKTVEICLKKSRLPGYFLWECTACVSYSLNFGQNWQVQFDGKEFEFPAIQQVRCSSVTSENILICFDFCTHKMSGKIQKFLNPRLQLPMGQLLPLPSLGRSGWDPFVSGIPKLLYDQYYYLHQGGG